MTLYLKNLVTKKGETPRASPFEKLNND